MPSITITKWNANFPGFTAWDENASSELKKRLRRGVNAPAGEARRLTSQIRDRQLVTLKNVRAEAVGSITQILQTLGAELDIDLENANSTALFRKVPKRGR